MAEVNEVINTKKCSKCGEVKPFSEFYKSKKEKLGIMSHCKECDKKKGAAYYAANSDKVNARVEANRKADPEKVKAWYRSWYENNKDANHQRSKRWRLQNPERSRQFTKNWEERNPGSSLERNRRRRETVRGKLENSIRAGFHRGITSESKSGRKTFDLLGYTVDEVRRHLEKQFLPGMSWDNYGTGDGKWHIDHKIPLSVHNYETPDDIDFKRAWSLSNLQPLWGRDNLSKSDKLTAPFQPSFAFGLVADNDNSDNRKAAA